MTKLTESAIEDFVIELFERLAYVCIPAGMATDCSRLNTHPAEGGDGDITR